MSKTSDWHFGQCWKCDWYIVDKDGEYVVEAVRAHEKVCLVKAAPIFHVSCNLCRWTCAEYSSIALDRAWQAHVRKGH